MKSHHATPLLDLPTFANPNPPNPLTAPFALSTPHKPPSHAFTKKHVTLSPVAAPLPMSPNLQNIPTTCDALPNPNRGPDPTSPLNSRAPSDFEDKVECQGKTMLEKSPMSLEGSIDKLNNLCG